MANLLEETWRTYLRNIKLVLLFSIPFIISFLIPVLAPMPAYVTAGGIFLRTAGLFININPITLSIIVIAVFFSLLFLSFAFVAISLIVKSERTHTKIATSVLKDTEKYTGRVFILLLFYVFVLFVANIIGYYLSIEAALTAVVGFVLFMAIFYAPTAIVIDNKRLARAIEDSVRFVLRKPQYFVLWFLLIAIVLSVLDYVFVGTFGGVIGSYVLLLVNSLFVVPYFVIYQAQAYMKRFPILMH
ncbi:MAG: hypothetical protein ACP5MC_00875 [Candidatus Micrarchaeia archaeon]